MSLPKHAICGICHKPYENYGNNAEPLIQGRCCDECHHLVMKERFQKPWSALLTVAMPDGRS